MHKSLSRRRDFEPEYRKPCREPDDAAQERAIARAVWTDLLWLMPTGRTVTVTVRDGNVAVALGPREQAPEVPAH